MRKNKLPKIIVIVGPTASGKSDLAVKVAKKIGGEIISADSRQVYRGMDIGTGKITKKEMWGIPHHLLDVASPKRDFNVFHFKKLAEKKIKEIIARGRVPVVVGGTGFWIDTLIYDWPIPEVGPNRALRARLGKWPAVWLFAKLQELDPARAVAIKSRNEINNKRRLVRALEIILITGQKIPRRVLLNYHDRDKIVVIKTGGKEYGMLILGIKLPQKELENRIYKRLLARLNRGMVEEVKKLRNPPAGGGVSWKRLDDFGLEYRFVSRYLRGRLAYDEMVTQLFAAIKKYAKRQMAWFKRNKKIRWVNPPVKAEKLIERFLS